MALHTGKNIYITGFMATGKSTVGRLLARKLARQHLDTDRQIEEQENTSIANLFQTRGEEFFRNQETICLKNASQKNNLVVSLGGGAILANENKEILNKGVWIYLDTPIDIILERLTRTTHRPLAQQDPDKLHALYTERLPLYKMANITIDCQDLNSEAICQDILKRMMTHENH
jgi:shikimate kinase